MKETGVIRRIDDIGRIVIPRSIRKACGIYELDEFEICYDNNGIYLKKVFRDDFKDKEKK